MSAPLQTKRPARGANSTPAGKAKKQPRKSTPRRFEGTENPRYLRILAALLARARTREEIDRTAGASNGPAAIAELRALGLPKPAYLPCERTRCYDRDGEPVQRGVYSLTAAGRRRVHAWLRRRDAARGRK